MKKIYISFMALIFTGSMFAQNVFNAPTPVVEQGFIAPNAVAPYKTNSTQRGPGPFSAWFEPVGDVMTQKGLLLDGSTSANQRFYLSAIFQDSTVQVSSSTSTRFVSSHLVGSVLDPKSTYLQASFDPVVTPADPYTVDSVMIVGSYVKVTPATDTLYVWMVWGDTADAGTWAKRPNNTTWVSPISTWRSSVIGPKVSGAAGAAGNLIKCVSTNMQLIKYPLAQADSSRPGYSKYINIPLATPISVPAGAIFACMATFVPGGTYNTGDVAYGFTGGQPQTINGFGAIVWNQQVPAVTSVNDYQNDQVDPDGWNMGLTFIKQQRHATWASAQNDVLGQLTSAPYFLYKISGTSTIGINEYNSTFALGQNQPNPFGGKTIINYQIKKDASNVSFEVYDIKGSLVYNEKELNGKQGNHSIELNSTNLNAGVYFYSLLVDGNKITKKMVITSSK